MGGPLGGDVPAASASARTSRWVAGVTRWSRQNSGFASSESTREFEAVRDALAQASTRGLVIRGWCADLTRFPLPRARFELIVVSRYLQRDLFPSLGDA